MVSTGKVIEAMIDYLGSDTRRINHFLKVFALAKTIGEGEGLCPEEQNLLETAAVVHDIGIKRSEEKYGSSSGKYQQIEGPGEAEKLLLRLECDKEFIDKVCFLVGHHHTYTDIDSPVYQILVEADFIVNLNEEGSAESAIRTAYVKIFRTETGKNLMKKMYLNS